MKTVTFVKPEMLFGVSPSVGPEFLDLLSIHR